eukprot:CAMPEP_0171461108 /NCGR_PEP_ID=MMETSP0945-20130129/5694_1 /TAXON_ID=109269 /ORGANISM="Vaucheria litorea, Strain CCMP2940" /LENGTH=108 /DNA_ID=CAMNT_0011987401 /DNA_START=232 /DNA_END=555 /DNA_ORIENTATION=+
MSLDDTLDDMICPTFTPIRKFSSINTDVTDRCSCGSISNEDIQSVNTFDDACGVDDLVSKYARKYEQKNKGCPIVSSVPFPKPLAKLNVFNDEKNEIEVEQSSLINVW